MKEYRLTYFFVITSLVVISIAAITVNLIIGDLAEDSLIRIAEENTARNADHIQSMMRGGHSMQGMPSAGTADSDNVIKGMQQAMPSARTAGSDMAMQGKQQGN